MTNDVVDLPPQLTASTICTKPMIVWAAVAVALITFYFHCGSLHADFVQWDDNIEIYQNPHITSLDGPHLSWMFTDISYVRRYIPLDWLSWAINYRIGGLNPFGYHLGNVLLHSLSAAMLVLILYRIFAMMNESASPRGASHRFIVALAAICALLWALHPLRVEAVAWANSRIYTQCLFFLLVSFLLYLRAHDPQRAPDSRRGLLWLSVIAYFCSLLCYGTSIGYPVVLLVVDAGLLKRFRTDGKTTWFSRQTRRVWIEKLPYALAAMAYLGITVWARIHAHGIWEPPPTLAEFSLSQRLMQALYLLAYYAWKPLVPFHLSPVYTTLVHVSPTGVKFVLSALVVLGISIIAFISRRVFPLLGYVWICHLVLLFPMLGFFEHPHFPSDRYTYIQGILWSVFIGGLIVAMVKSGRIVPGKAAVILLAAISLGLGILTQSQTGIWTNSETLFRHMIGELDDDPYRFDIYFRLGRYYLEHAPHEHDPLVGRREATAGLGYLDQCLTYSPGWSDPLAEEVQYFNRIGELPQAEACVRRVIALQPTARSYDFLGQVTYARGNFAESENAYARAIKMGARWPGVHIRRGFALKKLGRNAQAEMEFKTARELEAGAQQSATRTPTPPPGVPPP